MIGVEAFRSGNFFKLINMNGRVYDPQIGRFLSPDNYIQSPDFTQSYNRYSYCMNNPLSYTDPSGMILIQSAQSWFERGGGGTFEKAAFHNGSGIGDYFGNNSESADSDWGYSGGSGGAPGSQGYSYNWYTQTYTDNATGETVDSDIAISYAINQADKKGEVEVAKITPVYEFQCSYNSSDNAWHVDENGPVPHYYQLVEWKNFDPNSTANNQSEYISSLALDIGGGIYGGLRTAVTPGDQWLGKNGKYYNNSWGGNRYTDSRSGAFAASNTYKWAGRAIVGATAIIGGIQVCNGYQMDGGKFGYNTNLAGAGATGGIVGGWAGAEAGTTVGAAIGVWFGGVGAVPGAIIGGFVGEIAGSLTGNKVGEMIINYYYGR